MISKLFSTVFVSDNEMIHRFTVISDNGYTDNDSYNSLVVTAWIPFVDTDETNGCLQVQTMLLLSLFAAILQLS